MPISALAWGKACPDANFRSCTGTGVSLIPDILTLPVLDSGNLENTSSLLAVPVHSAAQAFFKIHRRFVTQAGFCFGDVGEGVLDVAAALGTVFGFSSKRR